MKDSSHHTQDYETRCLLKSLPPFASRNRFCSNSSFMIRSASLIGFCGAAVVGFLVGAKTFFFGTVAKTFLGLFSVRPIGFGAAFEPMSLEGFGTAGCWFPSLPSLIESSLSVKGGLGGFSIASSFFVLKVS